MTQIYLHQNIDKRSILPDLMNLSSRGLSSRLRGSTLSGNWAIERHSRLRKLGKSVLSLGSEANFSCSRNSTPTSPLSMTSQPGSPLTPDSSSSSPSSCNSFSMRGRCALLPFAYFHQQINNFAANKLFYQEKHQSGGSQNVKPDNEQTT